MDIPSEIESWPAENRNNFRQIDDSEISEVLPFEIIVGSRLNSKFVHTKVEKQLYTAHDFGKYGRIYRCRTRKCPARLLLLKSGKMVKLVGAKMHNHTTDCAQEVRNFKALNSMKFQASDLRNIAGGRRIKKVKDIFTEVMVE